MKPDRDTIAPEEWSLYNESQNRTLAAISSPPPCPDCGGDPRPGASGSSSVSACLCPDAPDPECTTPGGPEECCDIDCPSPVCKRRVAELESDTVPRLPGCQCQLEEGDSPCRVHGDNEEPVYSTTALGELLAVVQRAADDLRGHTEWSESVEMSLRTALARYHAEVGT